MPTYDYRCGKCGHAFEHFQSMKDSPLKVCPSCKSRSLERLIGTGAAVLFKGSGFYQTDYRSESYAQAAKADQAPAASTEAAPTPASTQGSTGPSASAVTTSAATEPPSAKAESPAKATTKSKAVSRRRTKR